MFIEYIRKLENGKILMGYIFVVAWSTDIFAYLIGKNFGKHKFSQISPQKTREGCIAGIIGAIVTILVYTLIINKFCQMEYSYITFAILGMVLSIISQIGDFAASTIKRYVDIKDYSELIPGHGGIVDRIDSLTFVLAVYIILYGII